MRRLTLDSLFQGVTMRTRQSGASSAAQSFALRAVASLAVAALGTAVSTSARAQAAAASPSPPPALSLTLTPHSNGIAVEYVDVNLVIEKPQVTGGETLLRMPLQIVSIPTARYDGDAIKARDGSGDLPLTLQDEPPTPTGVFRRWLTSRATVGDVAVTYRSQPRAVSASTRPGPLFDLRSEGGGLNGAGITFLALPNTEHPYNVHLKWDLSSMPSGSRGVWSFGEGEVRAVAPAQQLAFSYYAAGPLRTFPASRSGDFTMYWFDNPPFDTTAVAANIRKLYAYMARFFRDEGSTYRVFIRKNPYRSGGGTALTKSFMFGYADMDPPTTESLRGLLAHEMTHNWPGMQGEHGDTAWYSEGTAEYYSILLSRRAGVMTAAEFLEAINDHASGYYTNPLQKLSNADAAKVFWSDGRAQRVPYGRGFMYLAQVDAQIRAQSGGTRSLDDLVLEIRARQVQGKPYGIPVWKGLLTAELGANARQEFDAMVAGERLVPPPATFAPCFKAVKHKERGFQLGFDANAVSSAPGRIRGLEPESAAAQAGVREGDEVLEPVFVGSWLISSLEATVTLKLRRDGQPLEITYLPRGEEVESYRWARVQGVPETACKL